MENLVIWCDSPVFFAILWGIWLEGNRRILRGLESSCDIFFFGGGED